MASEFPRFIMRDATIFINRISYVGQCSEITFPELKEKREDIYNGGMETPIDVHMGYEKPEMSFKLTAFDPAVMTLFGLRGGAETELLASAHLEDDDGTSHTQLAYIRGQITEYKQAGFKRGDGQDAEYQVSYRYYKLVQDDVDLIEITPFRIVIGGVDQSAAKRRALLLS